MKGEPCWAAAEVMCWKPAGVLQQTHSSVLLLMDAVYHCFIITERVLSKLK